MLVTVRGSGGLVLVMMRGRGSCRLVKVLVVGSSRVVCIPMALMSWRRYPGVIVEIDHVGVRNLERLVDGHRSHQHEWGIRGRGWVGHCEVLLRLGFGFWFRFGFLGRLG